MLIVISLQNIFLEINKMFTYFFSNKKVSNINEAVQLRLKGIHCKDIECLHLSCLSCEKEYEKLEKMSKHVKTNNF